MTAPIDIDDLGRQPLTRLQAMLTAGEAVVETTRALTAVGSNPVAEMLRGQGRFYKEDHYPKGDVFDPASHAQYYYHAHRGGTEHGHFHTFVAQGGMPPGVEPSKRFAGRVPTPSRHALTHLVAVAMDEYGRPIALFTTNRWVTDETWYSARDVIAVLDRFTVGHDRPSRLVNRWIGGVLGLFQPTIVELLRARDQAVEGLGRKQPTRDPLEDPGLEITSWAEISIDRQMRRVRRALAQAPARR